MCVKLTSQFELLLDLCFADKMSSGNIGQIRVRDAGEYVVKNVRWSGISPAIGRWISAYRAKYVTCKNARMTPFFHMVGVCMVLNYIIDYKFHLKHEKLRKYH